MKKVLFSLLSISLILVACNNNKEVIDVENVVERKVPANTDKEQSNDKKEDKSKKEIDESDKSEETEDNDVFIKYEDLTHEHILALAILGQKPLKYPVDDPVGDINIFPTSDEYLSGKLKMKAMGPVDETIVFDEIGLIEIGENSLLLNNPPYSVDLYSVSPDTGTPQYIAIGEEKVLMFITNADANYETMFEEIPAAEYNIRELYEEYIDDPRFIDLSNMIHTYESWDDYPMPEVISIPIDQKDMESDVE